MKLTRSGHYKNMGTATLIDADIETGDDGYSNTPVWMKPSARIFLEMTGVEGQATYNYNFHLSGNELAIMIEKSLIGASQEVAVHAEAKAIAAYVREILSPKTQAINKKDNKSEQATPRKPSD